MKKIIPEYEFQDGQTEEIARLARSLSLTPSTVKILYARGIDTEEKIKRFLSPSAAHFLDPFLMSGMKETADTLRTAKEEGWRVAVFGDYDADGICASTIMYKALKDFGIEPYVYVPERSDGYGLSVEAIDTILDEYLPDLFLTVDCGISNADQVRYLQEQGVYVIVTDHHELPERLPDCICVNPKFADAYPYDNLCGAGVAFKIAVALLGESAYQYIDYAALATVADSVPLLGENRDIVAEGLKKIKENPRTSFSCLLGKNDNEVTAQTLAFTLAPRINAAGRMGDAKAALSLFLSDTQSEIFALAAKLNAYNTERQCRCDELYEDAKEKLKKKGAYGNVIMLSGENWSTGFVGIVAARLAEEFYRPAILFVKNGDSLKGSARSIESVNIFEALRACSAYIEEFGGHSQAAGVNVKEENFDKLEQALNEYIGKTYAPEDFVPKIVVSEEITEPFSPKFAHELDKLEPYGVGHKKPLFSIRAHGCPAREVKPNSPHLVVKSEFIDLMYFGGAKQKRLIESDIEKYIVFDCNVTKFKGREYIKGYIRDVVYNAMSGNISPSIFANAMAKLRGEEPNVRVHYLSAPETRAFVAERAGKCGYGLCLLASSRASAEAYGETGVRNVDVFVPTARNVANTLLISPQRDADLSAFNCFVFLDEPSDFNILCLEGKEVYVNKDICGYRNFASRVNTERAYLLDIFAALRKDAARLAGGSAAETAQLCRGLGFDVYELIFALSVFEELGLLSYAGGKLEIYRGVKADLNDSAIYTRIRELQRRNTQEKRG